MKCLRIRRGNLKYIVAIIILIGFVMFLRQLSINSNLSPLLSSSSKYKLVLNEHEKTLRLYESKMIPNLGNNGEPAFLEGIEAKNGEAALKKIALNSVLSDRMPLNRTLKDPRNKK